MIPNEGLVFAPWKGNFRQINKYRGRNQPVKIVMPARVQNFIDKVICIAYIAICYYFDILFHAAKIEILFGNYGLINWHERGR